MAHDLLPALNNFPFDDRIKSDPRWAALMRRIGLNPAPAVVFKVKKR